MNRSSIHPSERWLLAQTLFCVMLAAVTLGTRDTTALPWVVGVVCLAGIPIWLRVREDRGQTTDGRRRRPEDRERRTEDGGTLPSEIGHPSSESATFADLLEMNLKTPRAWLYKEQMVEFWHQENAAAGERFFMEWYRTCLLYTSRCV